MTDEIKATSKWIVDCTYSCVSIEQLRYCKTLIDLFRQKHLKDKMIDLYVSQLEEHYNWMDTHLSVDA